MITKQMRMSFGDNPIYAKIAQTPHPTEEEQMELFRRYWNGDKTAGKLLVEKNLRMVLFAASKYATVMEFDDAFSIGALGLQKAIDGYDGERLFSTYAINSIDKVIKNELQTQYSVYFPRHAYWELEKIKSAMKKYQVTEPEDIAAYCDFSVEKVKRYLFYINNGATISLETPVKNDGEDSDENLADFIGEETDFDEGFLKKAISSVLSSLPPKEAKVLSLYYGLENNAPMTLDEIGKHGDVSENGTKLTRERIRQIRSKALNRIRNNPKLREQLEAYK